MIKSMPSNNFNLDTRRYKEIPNQYSEELILHLLDFNLNREALLSIILLIIDIALLVIDAISTEGWRTDNHIYAYFSYLHIILMIIPSIFLIVTYYKNKGLKLTTKQNKLLHMLINLLVLIFCALISIYNETIDRFPYPYIIAMFCIASTVLLNNKERAFLYTTSYMLYVTGSIVIQPDLYHFVRDIFFISLLFVLALIVSHMHYSFFITNFINQKIILDKNKELDILYSTSKEALDQRTEELNETVEYEKLRAAFFANISHELKTPLTVIFSAEQMLDLIIKREGYDIKNNEIKTYMQIIKQNCYRLTRLVANFIDITKIDAGYMQINLRNCEIIKVVEDITLSVAKYIEDRDINLIFDTDTEELTVACDPDKIERIILNLLSNAVKFTPKGGNIYVTIDASGDMVKIHVGDTGIGIPKNMQQSIFERFIQVDKTISRNHEGSGIGLSLVKSLLEMHGGNIKVISEEEKGSEFIIELPKVTIDCKEEIEDKNFTNVRQNVEKINIEFSDIYN